VCSKVVASLARRAGRNGHVDRLGQFEHHLGLRRYTNLFALHQHCCADAATRARTGTNNGALAAAADGSDRSTDCSTDRSVTNRFLALLSALRLENVAFHNV